ncbi:MAG TPA: hypothetical protein VFZ77_17795, partial [Acidimicrobiales bacterium]
MRHPRRLLATVLALVAAAGCGSDGDRAAGPALAVAGYVAPWDPRSRAALDRAPAPLTQLSPVWYRPAA